MKTKQLTIAGLLGAANLLIILVFAPFLRVYIPPFTATLLAHTPLMLAMMMGPAVAAGVGFVSAIGFTITLGPVVGARALMHVVIGWIGGKLYNKGVKLHTVLLITLPIHAILEGIVVAVALATGMSTGTFWTLIYITVAGTALHHVMDSVCALAFVKVLGNRVKNGVFNEKSKMSAVQGN